MDQTATDEALALWERMYSYTHPSDLEGERIKVIIVRLREIQADCAGMHEILDDIQCLGEQWCGYGRLCHNCEQTAAAKRIGSGQDLFKRLLAAEAVAGLVDGMVTHGGIKPDAALLHRLQAYRDGYPSLYRTPLPAPVTAQSGE